MVWFFTKVVLNHLAEIMPYRLMLLRFRLNIPQTPNPQMAREVSGWVALHMFIVAGANEAGEAVAALRDIGINHGLKLGP